MELTKPFRESNPRVSYLTCQRSDLYFKHRFLKLLDQQRWTALECYKHSTFRVKIRDGVLVGVKIKQKYICVRKFPRFDPVMTSTDRKFFRFPGCTFTAKDIICDLPFTRAHLLSEKRYMIPTLVGIPLKYSAKVAVVVKGRMGATLTGVPQLITSKFEKIVAKITFKPT